LVDTLCAFLKEFQERRAKVTDDDVVKFMEHRKIDPFPAKWKEEMDRRAAEKAKLDAEKKKAKDEAKAKQEGDEDQRKATKLAAKEAKKEAARLFAIKKKEEEEAKAKENA